MAKKKRTVSEVDVDLLIANGVDRELIHRATLPDLIPISRELRMAHGIYRYLAYVQYNYDGDSYTLTIDHGFGITRTYVNCRAYGINTNEVSRRGGKTDEHVRIGKEARDIVRAFVDRQMVIITTHLNRKGQDRTGKFGRPLVELFVEDFVTGELFNLNHWLLENDYAVFNVYGDEWVGWTEL